MREHQRIQVFEHEKIYVRGWRNGLLTQGQFEALVRYNDEHDHRYFRVIHKGIQFRQYVGVIQVGKLTIEILPKTDRRASDEAARNRWHNLLFDMLQVCRLIKTEDSRSADLLLRNRNLLDVYLQQFLTQVEKLLHRGLSKQYYYLSGNRNALVGQLKFQDHLARNLVHKERFFVRHQTYAHDHLLNQVLVQALQLISRITTSTAIIEQANRLQIQFPKVSPIKVSKALFQQIQYNRKTVAYEPAIELAQLILLNFSPDLHSGGQHIMAILLDMNVLFEEYIYRMLKRAVTKDIKVCRQRARRFWEYKQVRPDIVIQKGGQTVILDTKWKVLETAKPSDADLKQMYVYHHYFAAQQTVLLYPEAPGLTNKSGVFHRPKEANLNCQLMFASIINEQGQLDREVGVRLLEELSFSD